MTDSFVVVMLGTIAIACSSGAEPVMPPPPPPAQAVAPAPRVGHSMVFDEARRVTLVFGGATSATFSGLHSDLWSWDGQRWTPLSATGPAPRADAVFAYDVVRQRAVLFGGTGRSASGTPVLLTDTWEWDGVTWAKKDDATLGMRHHAVGAYDRGRSTVVLYGGYDATNRVRRTDTWEWNGQQWTQRSTTGPDATDPDAMIFDDRSGRLVAIHGTTPPSLPDGATASTMWSWTGQAWTRVQPDPPPLKLFQPIVSTGSELLLYNGSTSQSTATTWTWNGTNWRQLDATSPAPRLGHAMAFDRNRNKAVLYGGADAAERTLNELWEWDGQTWIRITPL